MANTLILNQSQVWNGLGTLTYVVPTTGVYNVQVQSTVPQAVIEGDGAGSGTGLGSGAGGGGTGFSAGGAGTSHGGVGQGFGANVSGYNQPPTYGSNETTTAAVSSSLVVLVKDNGSTIYTAPTVGQSQSSLKFKYGFTATAGHSITVVFSSAAGSDNQLAGVTSNVSIGQGL